MKELLIKNYRTACLLLLFIGIGCSDADLQEPRLDTRAQELCWEAFTEPGDWTPVGEDEELSRTYPVHRDGCMLSQATIILGPYVSLGGKLCNACTDEQTLATVSYSPNQNGLALRHRYADETWASCFPNGEGNSVSEGQRTLKPGEYVFLGGEPAALLEFGQPEKLEVLWPKVGTTRPSYDGAPFFSCRRRDVDTSRFSVQPIDPNLPAPFSSSSQ